MSESRTFPTCTRGDKPHPDVPAGTLLAVVEGSRDELGRERFSLFWYEPDREGRVERIAARPGGPSRPVAMCGHRAQCFHAVLDPYVQRAEDRGERVVVERHPERRR